MFIETNDHLETGSLCVCEFVGVCVCGYRHGVFQLSGKREL